MSLLGPLVHHRFPRPGGPRRGSVAAGAVAAVMAVMAVAFGAPAPASAEPRDRAGGQPVAAVGQPVVERYRPPVDAPIIDPFRPPPHPYGPGNRGLSYAVAPLTPIRAAGAGEVIFAGPVGGALHVTVRHGDGLRTSYSFLAATAVVPGMVIDGGTVIGWSSEVFHFGVRTPDGTYLDPELLWRGEWEPRLVPGGDDGAVVAPERPLLLDVVRERAEPLASWVAAAGRSGAAVGADVLVDFDRRLRLWMHYAVEMQPEVHVRRMTESVHQWARQRADCTAADQVVAAPAGRRIVVEVGGIGSTSEAAAVARIDTVALGYDDLDVVRFSYAGGRVPPAGAGAAADAGRSAGDPFGRITTTTYAAVDSQIDVEESGRRLSLLLEEVADAAPGVPIDVIAHSQGGVVSRLGLDHAARTGRLPREVENLVTLGSPHRGADLATAIEALRADPVGAAALDEIRHRLGVELDPSLPAASQLSEVSPVIVGLATQPVPDGVRFTSVAARGDLVVPSGATTAPGAHRATVSIMGVGAHDHLPESTEATREMLLALGGHPPTCRSLHDTVTDVAVGGGIALLQDTVGAAAGGAALAVPG